MWAWPVIIFPKALEVILPLPSRWQKSQPKELHVTTMGHYLWFCASLFLQTQASSFLPQHSTFTNPRGSIYSPRITARAWFPLAGHQETAGGSHFAECLTQGDSDICIEQHGKKKDGDDWAAMQNANPIWVKQTRPLDQIKHSPHFEWVSIPVCKMKIISWRVWNWIREMAKCLY